MNCAYSSCVRKVPSSPPRSVQACAASCQARRCGYSRKWRPLTMALAAAGHVRGRIQQKVSQGRVKRGMRAAGRPARSCVCVCVHPTQSSQQHVRTCGVRGSGAHEAVAVVGAADCHVAAAAVDGRRGCAAGGVEAGGDQGHTREAGVGGIDDGAARHVGALVQPRPGASACPSNRVRTGQQQAGQQKA